MNKQCEGPECESTKIVAHGLCMGHWKQQYEGKELAPLRQYLARPEPPEGYAFCNKCKSFKLLSEFYFKAGKPRHYCKVCMLNDQKRRNSERKAA